MEDQNSEEIKKDFESFLKAKGLMNRTIKEYLRYSKVFEIEYPNLIKGNALELKKAGLSFIVKHNNIVARSFIVNYFDFKSSLYSGFEIFEELKLPRITGRNFSKKDVVKYLTREEINKLNEELNNLNNKRRNCLMLSISFQGGLRRDELFRLTPRSFRFNEWDNNQDEPLDLIVLGKRNKKRIVNLTPDVAFKVKEYIQLLQEIKELNKDDPLFYSSVTGLPLNSKTWENTLKKVGLRVLDKEITPHMLRHSCAMFLKDQCGWPIEKISKYLGHSSISTTMIYARTTNLELKRSFKEGFMKNESE